MAGRNASPKKYCSDCKKEYIKNKNNKDLQFEEFKKQYELRSIYGGVEVG